MDVVHHRGVNCFHDCVFCVARGMGVDYTAAFADLWTESDFRYDPHRETYLSKRLITNLEALGARVRCFDCFMPGDAAEQLAHMPEGDCFIVGMDAYHIPWNRFFGLMHGNHYIVARRVRGDILPCCDPTYGIGDVHIDGSLLCEHTFDFCRVDRTAGHTLAHRAADEARAVLRTHGAACEGLVRHIHAMAEGGREALRRAARYADALLENRRMYHILLEREGVRSGTPIPFLNGEGFARWNAIKHGLFKASLAEDNAAVLEDVCARIERLMRDETDMATAVQAMSADGCDGARDGVYGCGE